MRTITGNTLAILEWNRGGHHETYLKLYVCAMLACGRKLVVLCRNPPQLLADLAELGVAWATAEGRLVVAEIPGMSWLEQNRRWPRLLRNRAYAWQISRVLHQAEQQLGEACHTVYFSCLYEHQTRTITALVATLKRPWSGLYLQAGAFHAGCGNQPGDKDRRRLHRLLDSTALNGLLMLDEGVAGQVEEAIGRPVTLVPDLSDGTCKPDCALAAKVREFAGSRPLVALLGHLLPSKGAATLAAMSLAPEASDLALLFAGEIYWELFSEADRQVLTTAKQQAPRAMFHETRIADEATYNSLVRTCDVLFAAYHGFPHSSNTLTKAALFEKPIIVSDGHLMAARVREYRLGEVVPAGDIHATLAAVRRITHDPAAWQEAMQPRWEDYRQRHSFAELLRVMQDFPRA